MNYKYTSINTIFAKIVRDLGEESIIEQDLIEWTGEALEFIGGVKLYEEAVAYIEVVNHQCDLPNGLHAIIQIAKNRCWTGPKNEATLCPTKIVTQNTTPITNNVDIPIVLDCNGMPLQDYDLAYYRPYFDMKYEYFGWTGSSYYRNCYVPVRLSTNTFFESLVCKEDNYNEVYSTCTDEYTIIRNTLARFSFKEGSVAISYLRQVLDPETGYPMIPDNISYTTAISKYITMKIFEKQFYAGRDGAKMKLDKAESDWHWYCKQATNVDMMPNGIDEHQNLLDQRNYLLPRVNRYYGFFGKLGRPEQRKYNDPDARNWKGVFFRGN